MSFSFKQLSRRLRAPLHRPYAFRRLAEFHSKPRSLEEVVDWGMDFGGKGAFRVITRQIPSEILGLAKMVEALKPKRILEIGTFRGGTLFIWTSLAEQKVVSCDLQDMSLQQELYTRFPAPNSDCEVVLLSGDSHTPEFKARVEAKLGGKQVDFLFIDGDHTEQGVEADYRDYHHLVRPGGLIAFHDIIESQPVESNQVYYFWKRLKEEAETVELVNDQEQCGYGIGVVKVPEASMVRD